MQRTLSGAAVVKGAVYEWENNGDVGKGRMEITDALPSSRVTIKPDFIKPFEAHNITEFSLDSKGGSTTVTWAMHGKNTFIGSLMGVFMNMDTMIGKDFEAGLSNMKIIAEKQQAGPGK